MDESRVLSVFFGQGGARAPVEARRFPCSMPSLAPLPLLSLTRGGAMKNALALAKHRKIGTKIRCAVIVYLVSGVLKGTEEGGGMKKKERSSRGLGATANLIRKLLPRGLCTAHETN